MWELGVSYTFLMPSDPSSVAVRPARSDDIHALAAFDHSYSTDYVWQVDFREEQGQITSIFRQVRLPRSMRVQYPRSGEALAANWTRRRLFIVAETQGRVCGYLSVADGAMADIGSVAEFAVERKSRRQGIGTALVTSAADWARSAGLRRLVVETQSKNYPAICFCQKHGFTFCGYNDGYYANRDIALFFGMTLK